MLSLCQHGYEALLERELTAAGLAVGLAAVGLGLLMPRSASASAIAAERTSSPPAIAIQVTDGD